MSIVDPKAKLEQLMKLDKSRLPEDGGDGCNRLIFSNSPYLLQHADNPVDWYEWGEAAFEKARRENLPIMVSIGYAACHWCHVMAEESFEDEEVAACLNSQYVCIKVDREERPDVDSFFMTVARILTGSGGWPLNVFMTPDRQPFFAMTYMAKRGRGGSGGFMGVIERISAFWQSNPTEIIENSGNIMEMLEHLDRGETGECAELKAMEQGAFKKLEEIYDAAHGGFGTRPKFPMPVYIGWLLGQAAKGNGKAAEMACDSLKKMRGGGVWDQLGGGLHRYAVDEQWLVPHFEKMLYDQAMLSDAALEAFRLTGEECFLEMAENIFWFVGNELTAPEGGFYASLDADSDGEEGLFYLWDKSELQEALGRNARLFYSFYGVTEAGNFEGRNILHIPLAAEQFCEKYSVPAEELGSVLDECREKLLNLRDRRERPLRDEKIISAWNGLMIAALAKGGVVCGYKGYVERAAKAADYILNKLRREDGRLLRSYLSGGNAAVPAFLEDYAFLCYGLIELYEATLDEQWLDRALGLCDDMVALFWDKRVRRFLKVGLDAEQLPVRMLPECDDVIPSAFSCAARCFIRLGYRCDRADLIDYAHALLAAPLDEAKRNPLDQLGALQAFSMLEDEPVRVVISGREDAEFVFECLNAIKSYPFANLVISHADEQPGRSLVEICANGVCYPAVDELDGLLGLLKSISAARIEE